VKTFDNSQKFAQTGHGLMRSFTKSGGFNEHISEFHQALEEIKNEENHHKMIGDGPLDMMGS
jgi:hypothetical protein